MKVVLLKDIKGLGRMGDTVEAANGYGRNYLIPNGLAVPSDHNLAKVLKEKKQNEGKKAGMIKEKATILAQKLQGAQYEFALPTDKKGNLYAGLKESVILAKIQKGESVGVKLVDYHPLKVVGTHKVRVESGGLQTEINILIHPYTKNFGKGVKKSG